MFKKGLEESIALKTKILHSPDFLNSLEELATLLSQTFKAGNKVLFCGNGGSAADAQHLAAELSGRFYRNRPALPAEALHVNTSFLTAIANDYGYHYVYARMIEAIGQHGDVLIAISTSGNSENIVKAVEAAREKGMITLALTGEGGGQLRAISDYCLAVPSKDTPRIQEVHILLGHLLCEWVENDLFPAD